MVYVFSMQNEVFQGNKNVKFYVGNCKVTTRDTMTVSYKETCEGEDGWMKDTVISVYMVCLANKSVSDIVNFLKDKMIMLNIYVL